MKKILFVVLLMLSLFSTLSVQAYKITDIENDKLEKIYDKIDKKFNNNKFNQLYLLSEKIENNISIYYNKYNTWKIQYKNFDRIYTLLYKINNYIDWKLYKIIDLNWLYISIVPDNNKYFRKISIYDWWTYFVELKDYDEYWAIYLNEYYTITSKNVYWFKSIYWLGYENIINGLKNIRENIIIKDADSWSFNIIRGSLAKDNKHVYLEWEKLDEIDWWTFSLIWGNFSNFAKDKNNIYYIYKTHRHWVWWEDLQIKKINDIDYWSFQIIDNLNLKDKKGTYKVKIWEFWDFNGIEILD